MRAIFRREFSAYFSSPMGFVLIVVFVALMGLLGLHLTPKISTGADWFDARRLSMESFFISFPWVAAVILPAISMRSWSEEYRNGTFQLLATLPIKSFAVVLAKYLAMLAFFGLMLMGTGLWPLMVMIGGADQAIGADFLPMLGGYFGAFLLGATMLAIGTWLSSITYNQMVAYLLTLMVVGGLVAWRSFAGVAIDGLGNSAKELFNYLSLEQHFTTLASGDLQLDAVIWYLGLSAFFLMVCSQIVEGRRYQ